MKDKVANVFSWIWFFGILLWAILFAIIMIFGIFFMNIVVMLKSGFSTVTIGFIVCIFVCPIFAITGWVPAFRRCYFNLPWLYPLCMMLMTHLVTISIAEGILSKGFSVISTPRHVITVIIVILQVIICRLAVCLYFKKFPMILHKYDRIN